MLKKTKPRSRYPESEHGAYAPSGYQQRRDKNAVANISTCSPAKKQRVYEEANGDAVEERVEPEKKQQHSYDVVGGYNIGVAGAQHRETSTTNEQPYTVIADTSPDEGTGTQQPDTEHADGGAEMVHEDTIAAEVASTIEDQLDEDADRITVTEDDLNISLWGLPPSVTRMYEQVAREGGRLFYWQAECLKTEGVLNGRNLVFTAPTGSGKSLVGDILAIRRLAPRSTCTANEHSEQPVKSDKIAVMALPYVALCEERERHLSTLLKDTGIRVRGFYSSRGGRLPKGPCMLICSYEKANSVFVRLINEGRIEDVNFLLVDEIHLVSDPSRGPNLEMLLTKAIFCSHQRLHSLPNEALQIVGLSATLSSTDKLANWLSARCYTSTFRPVPLQLYLKTPKALEDHNGNAVQKYEPCRSDASEAKKKHLSNLVKVWIVSEFIYSLTLYVIFLIPSIRIEISQCY